MTLRSLVLLLCCATPTLARAQTSGSVLIAGVEESSRGFGIRGVTLQVRGTRLSARTDSLGRARIAGVPAGVHVIEARQPGYAPAIVTARFSGRDSVSVTMLLKAVVLQLPSVAAVYGSQPGANLQQFEERRRNAASAGGQFIGESEIRQGASAGAAALLRAKLTGVRVEQHGVNMEVYSASDSTSSGGRCKVAVYLEGVRVANGDASIVGLNQLGGIEYYAPGHVPSQYEGTCGVLLLWLRD